MILFKCPFEHLNIEIYIQYTCHRFSIKSDNTNHDFASIAMKSSNSSQVQTMFHTYQMLYIPYRVPAPV